MYYKELEAWKEAMNLVTDIYEITETFLLKEMFGLISQIRRSVVSIPSNIAEGTVKHSDKETVRFLDVSLGSLAELDTQLLIAQNLKYVGDITKEITQISKVRALLSGLMKYYQNKLNETT